MSKKLNLISIIAIFIIPIVMFYILKTPESDNFSEAAIAASNKPTILKFSSPMCYECKKLDKVIRPIENKYRGKVVIKKLNTASSSSSVQGLVRKHNINVVPTMIFISKDGKVIRKYEGAPSGAQLDSMVKGLINS